MLKAPHKLGSMGKRRKTKKKRNKEEEAARGTLLLLTSQPWGGTNVVGTKTIVTFFCVDGAAAGK